MRPRRSMEGSATEDRQDTGPLSQAPGPFFSLGHVTYESLKGPEGTWLGNDTVLLLQFVLPLKNSGLPSLAPCRSRKPQALGSSE